MNNMIGVQNCSRMGSSTEGNSWYFSNYKHTVIRIMSTYDLIEPAEDDMSVFVRQDFFGIVFGT